MKRTVVVLCLAFTIRTSGQTPSTYTDHPNGDISLLPTEQSKLPTKLPPGEAKRTTIGFGRKVSAILRKSSALCCVIIPSAAISVGHEPRQL